MDLIPLIKMRIEKQGLSVLIENDKPIAILYRTKEGYWTWHRISKMDEAENLELIEMYEPETTNTKVTKD